MQQNQTTILYKRLPRSYWKTQWRRFFGLNVSQIEPLLFVGGEFRASQWPLLYELGIRAVLNLQAEREDLFTDTPPERTLRLLVRDYFAPSIEQLTEGVAFLAAAHADQLPVLVHCHAGVGRAPMTTAAYLVAQRGMEHRAAVAYLRAARPIIGLNWSQLRRLHEWEQHVQTHT